MWADHSSVLVLLSFIVWITRSWCSKPKGPQVSRMAPLAGWKYSWQQCVPGWNSFRICRFWTSKGHRWVLTYWICVHCHHPFDVVTTVFLIYEHLSCICICNSCIHKWNCDFPLSYGGHNTEQPKAIMESTPYSCNTDSYTCFTSSRQLTVFYKIHAVLRLFKSTQNE
jgi:hypothetical protein